MQNLRFIVVLLMLLTAGSTGYAYSFKIIDQPEDKEITTQLSEQIVDLSAFNLVTSVEVFNNRLLFSSPAILSEENPCQISKSRAYYLSNRFLEPGLSILDIIFPFHTFL